MNPPTQIAIAVVEHDNHFLIGLRPQGVALAGRWEFPGGKVHTGESPEQAAIRECLEETGLKVRVVGQYPTTVHDYTHDSVQLNFFRCVPAAPATNPASPFVWVPRVRLGDYQFPAGNADLLQQLIG